MMPTRIGSTFQRVALRRTRRSAACASATASCEHLGERRVVRRGVRVGVRDDKLLRARPAPGPGRPGNGPRGAAGSCCSVRYLSTKPAMPRSLSHSAAFTPSLSNASTRSAPPGAITTAAPVAMAGSGKNTDSVGSLTFAKHAVAGRRARDGLRQRPAFRAGRPVGPQPNFRLRAQRERSDAERGAEPDVEHPRSIGLFISGGGSCQEQRGLSTQCQRDVTAAKGLLVKAIDDKPTTR